MKAIVFHTKDAELLQKEINVFLEGRDIDVVKIAQSESENGITLTMLYTELGEII